MTKQSDEWGLPGGELSAQPEGDFINLEPGEDRSEAVAVEGDWHEIPSLKEMLYQESAEFAEKIKDMEEGSFVTIKEALKSHLSPSKIQFLRELRDVITDRNSVRDM